MCCFGSLQHKFASNNDDTSVRRSSSRSGYTGNQYCVRDDLFSFLFFSRTILKDMESRDADEFNNPLELGESNDDDNNDDDNVDGDDNARLVGNTRSSSSSSSSQERAVSNDDG